MGIFASRPDPNQDIVIIVVGPTGVGKSFLINTAVGRNEVEVGNTLESCTTTVQSVQCLGNSGLRVTFVDTPALQQDEPQTLDGLERQIKAWMKKAGVQQVAGILYLHRISDNRITAPSESTMAAFKRFCGKDVSSRIILMTTMWDKTIPTIGESRENEIKTNYWNYMLSSGSRVARFDKSGSSVWAAVDSIIAPAQNAPMISSHPELEQDFKANVDIVIAVIGPAGSGKSSLINAAVGRNEVNIGHTLRPCTTTIRSVCCRYRNEVKGQPVIFVDTPAIPPEENQTLDGVAKQLRAWMKKAGVQKVTGFLYLHKISDDRITVPPAIIMATFEGVSGKPKDVSPKVLVTTMWDVTDPAVGESRENEIKTRYWQNGGNPGFHILRSDRTAGSVWAAVDLMVGPA